MALSSMTGFARTEGSHGSVRWAWELRSVNGRGLDIRLRLPNGYDAIDAVARKQLQAAFTRGNISANLNVQRDQTEQRVTINEPALKQVMETIESLSRTYDMAPPRADGLLALRGILDYSDAEDGEEAQTEINAAVIVGLEEAIAALASARDEEGAAIAVVLSERVNEIEKLVDAAEVNPARQPDVIRAKLAALVAELISADSPLDPQRLHQEAVLLATKADIREELDRLKTHVDAARQLLAETVPVGRKLDFLAQEFNRESNTLCSKSNDASLTAIGLELKTVVDQLREQIQNIE